MRRIGSIALALLLTVIGTSCSSVKEELKPAPLTPIAAKLGLVKHWQKTTGAGQDARYARLQPAEQDGVVYTVDVKGKVRAYNAQSGESRWQSKIDKQIGGGVGIYQELGFVGTLDGYVVAFQLADGKVAWQSKLSSEVVSTPVSNGDVVVASAIDGRVFAFDFKSGEQRWTYDHTTPILSIRSSATPLISGSRVYIAFDNGQLLGFEAATGQLSWSARLGQPKGKTELERLIDSDTSPLEIGPYIYGAGYNSRLVAISSGTGRLAWGQDISTTHNIAAQDNTIVVVDVDSHVLAYDASNGSLLWENDKLHRRGLSAPGVFGSVVLSVDQFGIVHGFSLESGELILRAKLGDAPVIAQPLVFKERVLFYDVDGVLSSHSFELRESSGSIWALPTGRFQGAIPTKFTGVKKPQ